MIGYLGFFVRANQLVLIALTASFGIWFYTGKQVFIFVAVYAGIELFGRVSFKRQDDDEGA